MTVASVAALTEEHPAVKYAVPNYLAGAYGPLDVRTLATNVTLAEDISQPGAVNNLAHFD